MSISGRSLTVRVENSLFDRNQATAAVGALSIDAPTLQLSQCTIMNNIANFGAGGGVSLIANETRGHFQMDHVIFIANRAEYETNGGALLLSGVMGTINGLICSQNYAQSSGAFVWVSPLKFGDTISHLLPVSIGGCISLTAGTSLIIEESYLTDNSALGGRSQRGTLYGVVGAGGGISCLSSSLLVRRSKITHNNAIDSGGGISALLCKIEIVNTTLNENRARHGGGIFLGTSTDATLIRLNITSNKGPIDSGGIRCQDCRMQLMYSSLYNNTAMTDAGAIMLLAETPDSRLAQVTLFNVTVDQNTAYRHAGMSPLFLLGDLMAPCHSIRLGKK
jgi:hypothetical protein